MDNLAITFSLFIPAVCTAICLNLKKNYINLIIFSLLSVGAFVTNNIFILFICIEATTLPMYFLMQEGNKEALYKYLIYTLSGGTIILFGIVSIFLDNASNNIADIKIISPISHLFLLLGAALKIPIWPFSSWLPIVHGKSSTNISILLAAIILKFPQLILFRLNVPLAPIAPFALISSIIAAAQIDKQDTLKVTFSRLSIIHMNLYLFAPDYLTFNLLQHSITMILLFLLGKSKRAIAIGFYIALEFPGSLGFLSEIFLIKGISIWSSYIAIAAIVPILITGMKLIKYQQSMKNY